MASKLSKADLQEIYENQTTVPFKIIGINERGIVARIYGFKAFVSFHHMPFYYENIQAWEFMVPLLKEILFFAKIYAIIGEGECYLLDANISQFKTIELNHKTSYKGIIIHKTPSYCLVEMGASFNWKYGSIKGLMPNSKRDQIITFKDMKIGDPVSIYVYDKHQKGDYLVQGAISSRDWETGTIWGMLDKKAIAKVVLYRKKRVFIVDGKYKGEIKTDKKWYKSSIFLRHAVKGLVNRLKEGEEILVQVIRINENLQTLELRWIIDEEIEEKELSTTRNTIANIVGNSISFSSFEGE